MGELSPNVTVVLLGLIGAAVVAAITALPATVAIFVTDRRAATRDAAAAVLVAKVAEKAEDVATKTEEVAAKTEAVKVHLEESNTETKGKLNCLQHTADQIHTLVNDNLSEQFKQKKVLADWLLVLKPDDPEVQRLAKQAAADVDAHRPAESTTRGEAG